MHRLITALLSASAILAFGPSQAAESVQVSDTIATRTWGGAQTDYRVVGTVTVDSGHTLTIEEGVTVAFDADVQFVVHGALDVRGSAGNPVEFIPGEASEWGGIRIATQGEVDTCRFRHCIISGASADGPSPNDRGGGVLVSGSLSHATLKHCVLSGNHADTYGGGAMARAGATCLFENCTFERNEAQFGGAFANSGSTVFLSCSFIHNGDLQEGDSGVLDVYSGHVQMRGCLVAGNYSPIDRQLVRNAGALELDRCTVVGNTGGLTFMCEDGTFSARNSIIRNGTMEINRLVGAAVRIEYTNIDGGHAGVGNINADPLFVDPENQDYRLTLESPCFNAGDPASRRDPDGSRADMGAFPRLDSGFIAHARDVPNDQGGRIMLEWTPSVAETLATDTLIRYSIWRALERGAEASHDALVKPMRVGAVEYFWEWITDAPAARLGGYSYAVPTLSDSTREGAGEHAFMVLAHMPDGSDYYRTRPATGHSVDNLAPEQPLLRPARVEGASVSLKWEPCDAPDLGTYVVYRSSDPGFEADSSIIIGDTPDAEFTDSPDFTEPLYYGVAAVDIHGNVGPLSNRVLVMPVGIDAAKPVEFALEQNVPNPFNPVTMIHFNTLTDGQVSLKIYSVSGQLVKTLVDGSLNAGAHQVAWDGTDAGGNHVSSGVYIYRLTAPDGGVLKRMVLAR